MAGELTNKSANAEPVELRLKTDDELWYAVRDQTGISIPRIAVCPGHVAPFTAFADAFFSRSRNAVWHASRGLAGKSVMLAALAFMEGVEQGAAVNLLGGSGEQSQRVHGYMTGDDTNLPRTFWGHYGAPKHLLRSDPTKKETKLTNGGRIVVLQASTRSVRGPHPQKLRLDECLAVGSLVSTPNGLIRIEDVQIGDLVYGWNGSKVTQGIVQSRRHVGVRQTLNLFLSNGRILICTPDHEVLTNDGWEEAQNCKQGTILQGVRNISKICTTKKSWLYWLVSEVFSRKTESGCFSLLGLQYQSNTLRNTLHGLLSFKTKTITREPRDS